MVFLKFILTFMPPILCPEKMSAFYACCMFSGALQMKFYHGSKHYEPRSDCSLWEQSDLGPYCLQYRLRSESDGGADDKCHEWWKKG